MSQYLLLKDKKRCPNCRCRRPFYDGHCSTCGMRLFVRPIDFQAYEADGNPRRYWLWTNSEGWVYRDHIIEGLKPLDQHVDFAPISPVTKSAEERIEEIRSQTRAPKPTRNQVGYGKSITRMG